MFRFLCLYILEHSHGDFAECGLTSRLTLDTILRISFSFSSPLCCNIRFFVSSSCECIARASRLALRDVFSRTSSSGVLADGVLGIFSNCSVICATHTVQAFLLCSAVTSLVPHRTIPKVMAHDQRLFYFSLSAIHVRSEGSYLSLYSSYASPPAAP